MPCTWTKAVDTFYDWLNDETGKPRAAPPTICYDKCHLQSEGDAWHLCDADGNLVALVGPDKHGEVTVDP